MQNIFDTAVIRAVLLQSERVDRLTYNHYILIVRCVIGLVEPLGIQLH